MGKRIGFVALAVLLILFAVGCGPKPDTVQSISLDFPHGATRLLVQRDGRAFLFYGALPQRQKIKDGTFDIDELYRQLRGRLHDNAPRETWPDPKATAGMVSVRFEDNSQKDYLIFEEEQFAEQLFDKARKNVVASSP